MAQLVDGRYELAEVIGSGGMATVWRGRDTQLDRPVAVKRPHPLPPGDPRHDRLAREARLAASVSHPNLVVVHDAGSDEQGLYLVMEYIDAPSLREVGSTLDRSRILAAGAQVAQALTAVHAANVVHRDVKPSNVLLPPTGAKLVDFGVALAGDPMPGFEPTMAGVVFGTKGYAAPEVMAGQPATASSDVYAVGVMMAELLGADVRNTDSNGHGNGYDNSASLTSQLNDPAAPFLDRCLAVDPAARPSAAEVAEALQLYARGSAPTVVPPAVAPAVDGPSNGYDATVVMAAPGATVSPPPPTPTSASVPFRPVEAEPDPELARPVEPRTPGGAGIGWAVLAGLALVAVVGFVVNRNVGGQADNGADSAVVTTTVPITATTPPPTTAVQTTTVPDTTPSDEPVSSVTLDPDSDAAISDLGAFDDEEQAERIAYDTIREGLTNNGRPGDEAARKAAKKIADAFKENRNGKPEEAIKKLEEGARDAAEDLQGMPLIWTLAVFDTAARRMDLGEPEFSRRYGAGAFDSADGESGDDDDGEEDEEDD